jgi:hypothetical protein
VRCGREECGVDACFRTHDQAARLAQRFVQRFAWASHHGNDFRAGFTQNGNTAFVKRLGDDDAT